MVFETWRDYVINKKLRERRDAEKQYEREIKQFATAMQSVKIAQHHVSLWKKCVDIYTDQVANPRLHPRVHSLLYPYHTPWNPPYRDTLFPSLTHAYTFSLSLTHFLSLSFSLSFIPSLSHSFPPPLPCLLS